MTELTTYGNSVLSLLAPAVAISLAIITRRVLISLFAGIVAGILLLTNDTTSAIQHFIEIFVAVFWSEESGPNVNNLSILSFLLLLGILTSWIDLSGGSSAFAKWAKGYIKTRKGSMVLPTVLGVLIFIDDYFNTLVVGNVCRPITDQNKISRAKLAYITDSTSAPICVMMPMSSWGAYIIALYGSILAKHGIDNTAGVAAFVASIPMNFYAVFTICMVICVILMDINIGPMKKHKEAAERGELYDESKGIPPGNLEIKSHSTGESKDLIIPIVILAMSTVLSLVLTGLESLMQQGIPFSILSALEHTDVSTSLVAGALCGLLAASISIFRYKLPAKDIAKATLSGIHSMSGAIYILILAWMLIDVIAEVEAGKYLTSLVIGRVNSSLLPALIFVIAAIMAFSTGSSWGTFGVMLPLAGDMAASIDPVLILPMLSAVLAGAVMGDHCSPISDTTILSSTGASCHHIDHVVTQLPYCLTVALISISGYICLGYTRSPKLALATTIVIFIATIILMKKISETSTSEVLKFFKKITSRPTS